MIQINPLKSYIDGGVRAAITTPPSASLVFDLPGKAIWVKGVKLKGTDHTYTFSHDNYITLTSTPDSNESEDIKIGVNTSALKNAIDTTYGVVSTTINGLAPKFTSENKLAASAATTYYFLGWTGSTLKWYQAPFRNVRINSETTDRLGINNTDPLIISSGNGISVTWDSTNKKIIITNTKPDVNHNTDKTGIKLATVSGTKKTDSTLILANSATGLNIQGGTNKFLIGDGTNYIEVPITPSFTVSNKDATIGTALTTIATIAGVDIKAKIASYSLSNHTHSVKINGSTKTIAASGAVDLGNYLPLSGGTMNGTALISWADSGNWSNSNSGVTFPVTRGGLQWSGLSDYVKLFTEETSNDNLNLVLQFGDDNSNGLSIRDKSNVQTSYISAGGVITTGTFKGNLDWSYITNKPSSYTPSAHTHAWNSLTHSSTTLNQAILTNGSANGWKLYTLNISGWDNAANNAHSHSNKSVLDGITSTLVNNWNIAYNFVNTISGTDADKVINKWDEIVNFLAGISEDDKLNTLLNNKLSVYKLNDNTNVGTIKNNGIYYSTSDASSGTLINSPFNTGFTLINMTSYDGGDDLRRSRLAFNAYGEIKVSNDRGLANTAETWYNVLTSNNSGISGSTIKLNGTSITVYSSSTADGRYVKKAGDTMSGTLAIDTTGFGALVIKRNDDANGASIQFRGKSNIYGYIGLNNSTKDKLFLRWDSNASITYTILDTSSTYVSSGKGIINGTTITQVDNATNAVNANQAYNLYRYLSNTDEDCKNIKGSGLSCWYTKGLGTSRPSGNDSFILVMGSSDLKYNSLLCFDMDSTDAIYYRSSDGTPNWRTWVKILTSGNTYVSENKGYINGVQITYVNNAGNATNATNSTNARKLVNWYSTRPTSLNTQFGDGSLRIFHATSSTTEGKSPSDATVLHLAWDNNGGWDTQLGINSPSGRVYSRAQNAGTWQSWKTLAFTTDIPTSLKNPYALTISLNGTSQGPYDGSATKSINITPSSIGAAAASHNHNDRYYTKSESNVKYITDITTSINKLIFTRNGSNITRDITVNNVLSLGRRNPLTERNAISGIYTYGTYSNTDNLAPTGYFETLGFGEGVSGTIEIGGNWTGGQLYWRALRDCCDNWYSWKTILDSSNYSSILDSRYYTESEVNNLLSNKLNISNFNWTNLSGKLVAGNEFNIVNAGFNNPMWINYLPINDRSKTATITGYHFGNGATGYTSIKASGFIKNGSSSSYVLLGDGGHKAVSDFATSGHTHSIYAANENYGGFTKSGRLPISGFYQSCESESGGNAPWTSWMHLINCQHNNTGNNYALLITASFYDNNTFKIRVTNGNVNNAWRDIIHSGNISSQSVASATRLQTARNLWGNSFNGTADINGTIRFNNVTSGLCEGILWTCGDNDFARIKAGATGSDAGYLEIATADGGSEPIYVRQYSGVFNSVIRTLTLLDANGYSHFPSYINIGGNENNNYSPDRVWGSNGSDSYLRSYRTSALSVAYAASAGNATVLLTNNTAQAADACYNESPGLRFWRYNGTSSTTGQGGGDGWIMSWSWNSGSVGGQIYVDDNPTKIMCIRGRNNDANKTFTTWATILHSDNYTSYCATANHTHSWNSITNKPCTLISYSRNGENINANNWRVGECSLIEIRGTELTYSNLAMSGYNSFFNFWTSDGIVCTQFQIGEGAFYYRSKQSGSATITTNWNRIMDSNNCSVSKSGETLTVKINGTSQSLTNTWRGILDNLTSSTNTTQSLSAKQGYLLANGSARDNTKLPLSGGTMTGALNFKNGTWNLMGDDAYIGDCNVGGMIGVKGANAATPGFVLYNNSGTLLGKLYASGGTLNWSGGTIATTTFSGNASSATKLTSSAGSTTLPIYFSDGKPVACTASSVFSNLSNSGNNISVTVAGLNRTLTVGYSTNTDKVDGYHANTIYNAPSFTVNNSNTSNTYILLATITIGGTSLGCAEFTTLFQNRECLDSSSFILSGAIRRNSTTSVGATLSYITLHTKTPRNIYLRSDDGVTFRVYIQSATSTYTTYYRAIPIVDSRNITYSNIGTTSPISGSVINITATKGGNVNYANSADNADTLDNYHANGLLTALSNSNNGVSITVGGTTKSISNISVNYANSAGNADTVDGIHAAKFPYINNSGIWRVYGNAAAALADNTAGLSAWAFGESRNSSITYLGILKPLAATCGISAHGTIAVFGQGDTHMGIAVDYSGANFQVFGGNADKIVWRKKVAFTDSNVSSATNADKLDGYHEYSFLRYRDTSSTNGLGTLWSLIGIRSYHNALPDGLSGLYTYGQVISFPGNGSRMDIYTNHNGSADTINLGLWWRSGWADDKKTWRRIIDSGNIGSLSVNYATYSRYVYCTSDKYLNFQWSGLNGQPTWLFGSNDGLNVYVWNPSNFNVYKANKSDQLEAYTSWGFTDPGRFVRAIRYNGWHTRLYMGYYRDATLENTVHVGYADDADTLDGNHASAFALVGHTHNYDNVYSKLGHTHDDRYYTESEINSKLSAYLPLAGGTMTGLIKGNNKGGSWILGRANAALYLPRNVQGDWHPVVGFKTKTGSWEFGSVGYDDNASFSWESDSNYNSGTNTTTVVYLRNTSGTIALTSEIPTVTNYYWANMKVSSTSSTSTSPTFSTCYTSNLFRSTGLTGWYNETYAGGWYMTDTTWVRTYNSKGIYTNTGTIYNLGHAWLACNNGYNVGIGTTSPSYKLHVSGDSYATGWSRAASGFYCQDTGVHFTHNGTKGQIAITSNNEFCWGANSNILYFNYATSSLGTTVTSYVWNAGSSTSYASHTLGTLTSKSNIYAVHFYESSDIRQKTDFSSLNISTEELSTIPLFNFSWKNNLSSRNTGTSAQVVQSILPNIVTLSDNYLKLDYGVLGTIAGITACKELEMLKSELLQLKEKVKLLEDKLRKYTQL